MTEQTKTLPPSSIQAAVEASFTLREWSYDVVEADGVWTTTTSVRGPTGPTLLEVTVVPAVGLLSIRVDLGILPTTNGSRLEAEEFGCRISAERVDRVLRHLGTNHVRLAPLISRVARGQISAAEGLRLLRLGG